MTASAKEITGHLNREQVEPAFLRPPEAARFLGISIRHLGDLHAKGIIPGCKVGKRLMLYSRQELIRAIMKFQSGRVS